MRGLILSTKQPATITPNSGRLNAPSRNIRELSALTTSTQHYLKPSHRNKKRKRNGLELEKEEVKLLVFVDNVITLVEELMETYTLKKIFMS